MKALLVGYGKMGKAIEAALQSKGHTVVGRIDEGDRPDSIPVDIAFEFTTPFAAPERVVFLLSKKTPVVSGTTGWDVGPAVRFAREQKIPFLHSPNFSIGVAVMRKLAAQAAALLAPFPEFEPGVLERHHSAKKDAPSGTAKAIAAAIAGERLDAPVSVVALRQGGQPGEHILFFEGESESLEIVHRARSRAIFAAGAVAAAEWLLGSGRTGPVTFDEFLDAIASERTSR